MNGKGKKRLHHLCSVFWGSGGKLPDCCFSPLSLLCVHPSTQFCPWVKKKLLQWSTHHAQPPLRGFLQAIDINTVLDLVVCICSGWATVFLPWHSSACLWDFPKLPQSWSNHPSLAYLCNCLITNSAALTSFLCCYLQLLQLLIPYISSFPSAFCFFSGNQIFICVYLGLSVLFLHKWNHAKAGGDTSVLAVGHVQCGVCALSGGGLAFYYSVLPQIRWISEIPAEACPSAPEANTPTPTTAKPAVWSLAPAVSISGLCWFNSDLVDMRLLYL